MIHSKKLKLILTALVVVVLFIVGAGFSKAEKEIRFVSVGWTGVFIKTELAVRILNSLGYKASNKMVTVPIVYQFLDSGDADIFLGNWMPSMKNPADKFFKKGTVIKYVENMSGAKYNTLAAPSYVVDGGLKDFKDIAKFADKLEYKIYGTEEGNNGNLIIEYMIKTNMFGLGKFELVNSSETGMLLQVKSYIKEKKWIVFLGRSPLINDN